MKTGDSRIRLLAVLNILYERYPEWTTTEYMLSELEYEYHIKAERKTLYRDLYAIDMFVPLKRNRQKGYKLEPMLGGGLSD